MCVTIRKTPIRDAPFPRSDTLVSLSIANGAEPMITMMTEAEVYDEIAHIHVLLKNVQRQRRLLEH